MLRSRPASSSVEGRPHPPPPRISTGYGRRKVKERTVDMQYRDNSIFNATRKQQLEEKKFERSQRSYDRQKNIFATEVKKLQQQQSKIARAQYRMAATAMKKYSVFLIQALYRGHSARQFCRRLRSIRFLAMYLPRRYRWKKRHHASCKIMMAYKRYLLLKRIQNYHLLVRNAKIIQNAYRRKYLFRKAIARRHAMLTWKHVALFGVCRATHVICPLVKQRRVIFRCMQSFYFRMRLKRLLRWRNAYRLFYGLFFADSPLAKRHIQSRASSIIKRRSRAPFEGSRRSILQGINLELSGLIIERAPMNVLKRINQSATNDLMKHFKKKVLAAETKRIQSRKNSRSGMPFIQKRRQDVLQAAPPSSLSSKSISARLNLHRDSDSQNIGPDRERKSSLMAGGSLPSPTIPRRRISNAADRKISFASTNSLGLIPEGRKVKGGMPMTGPTFDDVINDYVFPHRLMKYRSSSQLDPNSLLANLKRDDSDKLVPYELRGNFRLKTIAEVVMFIQTLTDMVVNNPLLIQNPFDRSFTPGQRNLTSIKRDKTPLFIKNFLPFNGTFEYKIFRRGALSYDYESSALYDKLCDAKFSSGKRAMLRQHVIKSSAVHYQQERYNRRFYMNPMRLKQPQPPPQSIHTLDAIFLKKFEESSDRNKEKKLLLKEEKNKKSELDTSRDKTSMLQNSEVDDLHNFRTLFGEDSDSTDSDTSSNLSSTELDQRSESGDCSDNEDEAVDPAVMNFKFPVMEPNVPVPSFRRTSHVGQYK